MALEGTLRDFSLADILQLISLQNKMGLLALKSTADTVTLGFMEGRLVSAESAARRIDTRLGTVLVKTGRLTPEQLSKALEIQGQTLQRLGYILLKYGFCSADDLREGLEIQVRKIVYGLFRWSDGDYVFDQQDRIDYDHEFVTPILVESLLMEGARMIDEWPIIEKAIPSLDLVFQRVPTGQPVVPAQEDEGPLSDAAIERQAEDRRPGPIRVSPNEWTVYQLVDGRRSVTEIIDQTFLSEFDGCKALYDLKSRGLVQLAARGGEEVEKKAEWARPAGLSVPTKTLLAAALLLVALLAGFSFQSRNPLNLLTFPPRRIRAVEHMEKAVSLLRLRRMTEAVDTYYLTSGRFPDSIDAIVEANLLAPGDTFDPFGRPYRYILQLQSEKYYLAGFDRDGKTDIDLFFSNNLRLRTAGAPDDTRARSGKEIIVIE